MTAARKTYKVTGTQPVLGTPPGRTFTANLGESYERFLVDAGHVEIVTVKTTTAQGATPKKEKKT
jgi:hypothetical protein